MQGLSSVVLKEYCFGKKFQFCLVEVLDLVLVVMDLSFTHIAAKQKLEQPVKPQ